MIFTVASIIALIEQYGYAIILPIAIVEGPIVTLISGFLVSLGLLNAFLVFCVLVIGDLIGDTIFYALGKWGGVKFLRRWRKYLHISEAHIEQMVEYFAVRGWKILLASKTQAVGSVVLFSAGVAKMPYNKFIKYNIIGTVPKVLILEAVGFYGGASFAVLNKYVNGVAAVFSVVAILVVAWMFYNRANVKNS